MSIDLKICDKQENYVKKNKNVRIFTGIYLHVSFQSIQHQILDFYSIKNKKSIDKERPFDGINIKNMHLNF